MLCVFVPESRRNKECSIHNRPCALVVVLNDDVAVDGSQLRGCMVKDEGLERHADDQNDLLCFGNGK